MNDFEGYAFETADTQKHPQLESYTFGICRSHAYMV